VRRPLPHGRFILGVLIAIAAVAAAAYAWTLIPPSAGTKAAVLAAVVGYELAPTPVWPEAYRSAGRLSPAARDKLQAAYEQRMSAYATGGLLRRWLSRDFTRGLLASRKANGGRICIVGTGTVAYYDFRGRRPNGDLVVRVGVQHRYAAGRWDPVTKTVTDVTTDAKQIVVIMDYTLTEAGGVWKVAGARGWRFLDLTDGRITYDPPGSPSPASPSPGP